MGRSLSSLRSRRIAGFPLLDLALAAVLGVAAVADALAREQTTPAAAAVAIAGLVAAGSVALRRRAPLAMGAAFSAAALATAVLPRPATTLWAFVALLVVSFSAAAHLEPRRAALALLVLLTSVSVLQVMAGGSSTAEEALSPLVIVGGPALAGWLLRRSRTQAAHLLDLTTQLAAERDASARAAALAERASIARELHDVIAHTVSVMVVQAGAADELLPPGSPAREPVHAVRTTGRDALAELRRLLGVLRTGPTDDGRPQPGLDDIETLVAGAEAALAVRGEPRAVPATLGLSAYRIVQEALTNARRHGPPQTAIVVELDFAEGGLGVAVSNDGDAAGERGGGGHGLVGMRERVALFGGELRAGPGPGGRGWKVRAWLPQDQTPAAGERQPA